MSTSVKNTEAKESSISMHFDRDWKCLQIINQQRNNLYAMLNYDDRDWTLITLPHQADVNPAIVYWYRKQFEWRDKLDLQQHVYLNLSPDNDESDQTLNQYKITSIVVWLNEIKIYSGSLPHSVELTKHLQIDRKNILAICSTEGYPLSLHARVLLPRICVGQVNFDDIDQNTQRKRRHKLEYVASFNNDDGLIDVAIDSSKIAKNIVQEAPEIDSDEDITHVTGTQQSNLTSPLLDAPIPRLAIVMLIVGTRGDVQPFIALAKALLACGHRVRLATHETFRKFVRENGIEFYPLGGDPADLMSFMVKNAGILPSVSSIVAGDIAKSRRVMEEILASTWKACIEDDDETKMPFVAEAIIANPPSYGHIHCAQKLQIPLHMMFTMPWSPTAAFPHPFCKVDYSLGSKEKINMLSYNVIDTVTWTGIGDLINEFRKDVLGLSPLHTRQAVEMLVEERVPFSYCWSPSLVPKPADWNSHIDVTGFFFLDLASTYQPPADLVQFLKGGDPPIYIGFGSITGHDPQRILRKVLKALVATGYRALLSGLASDTDLLPSTVFRIGNCPHDWLFQHVAAVCHHGGAGTTAAGLRAGKPTIIVPFFGDQFFWGSMIYKSGAGPAPIPGKNLNSKDLIEAFKIAHEPGTRAAAEKLRVAFQTENGCEAAVRAFHSHLPLARMRSDLESSYAACFRLNEYNLQISRPVAQVLVSAGAIKETDLTIHPTRDWRASMHDNRPHVPIHGLLKHGRKALTSLFVDTSRGIRRAVGSGSFTTGTLDSVESVVRGVGKGIGHAYVGCLSFYGEITDTLERLPKLYDPYADSDHHERPRIDSFSAGAKAAEESIVNGFKDGLTGIVSKPQTGYQRHGVLGGAAGLAAAVPSVVIKPVVGTLASVTWLGRGIYAEAKQNSHRKDFVENRLSVLTPPSGHRRSSSGSTLSENDASIEGQAAAESGLSVNVCRHILHEFQRLTTEHEETSSTSTNDEHHEERKEKKKKSKAIKHLFRRQRSHSAAGH